MFYKVFILANNVERVYNVYADNRAIAIQKAVNSEIDVNKTLRYQIEIKGAFKANKFNDMTDREYENFKYEIFNF